MQKVINRQSAVVKEGTPDKEKSPYNPLRENNPLPETSQVCNCLGNIPRAGARARRGDVTPSTAPVGSDVPGRPQRKKRVDRALRQRMIEAAVGEAVRTFHGTWSNKKTVHADSRLWAGIARRIGADNMHFAVIDCVAEMRDERLPVAKEDQPRYFQAFLNRHYPKGKEKKIGRESRSRMVRGNFGGEV